MMAHITKIAAIETTNAIWEHDPELPGNRVLGGSLDVIAAIRTLAVKVSMPTNLEGLFRSSVQDSELNILISFSYSVRSRPRSEFHYMAILDGDQHIKCLMVLINYDRRVRQEVPIYLYFTLPPLVQADSARTLRLRELSEDCPSCPSRVQGPSE
jgi:hypothetical protein